MSYKYRVHDPRLGRFLSIDPLAPKFPYWTPYSFSGNLVINAKELEGAEYVLVIYSPDISAKFKAIDADDIYSQRALTFWARTHHFTTDWAAGNLEYGGDWQNLPSATLFNMGDKAPPGVSVITSTMQGGNIMFEDFKDWNDSRLNDLGAYKYFPEGSIPGAGDKNYPTDVYLGTAMYGLGEYVGIEGGLGGAIGSGSLSWGRLEGMGLIGAVTTGEGVSPDPGVSLQLGLMAFTGETVPTVENWEGDGFVTSLDLKALSGSYVRSADGRWQGGSLGVGLSVSDIWKFPISASSFSVNAQVVSPLRPSNRYTLREGDWGTNLSGNDPRSKSIRTGSILLMQGRRTEGKRE